MNCDVSLIMKIYRLVGRENKKDGINRLSKNDFEMINEGYQEYIE